MTMKKTKTLKGKRAILKINGKTVLNFDDFFVNFQNPLEYNDLMKEFVDKEEKDDKR
jgi:hypothetical protein